MPGVDVHTEEPVELSKPVELSRTACMSRERDLDVAHESRQLTARCLSAVCGQFACGAALCVKERCQKVRTEGSSPQQGAHQVTADSLLVAWHCPALAERRHYNQRACSVLPAHGAVCRTL